MRNIMKVASIDLRNKKTGVGIITHFMVLFDDEDKYYPYINLYYFKDKSTSHKHYIVNIEGKLEVAHNTYRKNWVDTPVDNSFGIESLFVKMPFRHNIKNSNLLRYINLDAFLPYELRSKYIYLMSNAIKDYIDNNPLDCMIFPTLINIIGNADSLDIPESNMNEEKESIVKTRIKKLVLDDYEEYNS